MHRRHCLASLSATVAAAGLDRAVLAQTAPPIPATGRIKHGVTRQVFGPALSFEDCCREAARLGVKGFDLVDNPADWTVVKKYGLVPSLYRLVYGGGVSAAGRPPAGPPGWNAIAMKEAQGEHLKAMHEGIDRAAASGVPNILLQAGSRGPNLSYEQGAGNAGDY